MPKAADAPSDNDKLLRKHCRKIIRLTAELNEIAAPNLQNVGDMAMADRIAFFKHGLVPALGKRVNHQSDGSQWTNLEDLIKYMVVVALAEQRPTAKIASADANFANIKLWYDPPASCCRVPQIGDRYPLPRDAIRQRSFRKARSRARGQ